MSRGHSQSRSGDQERSVTLNWVFWHPECDYRINRSDVPFNSCVGRCRQLILFKLFREHNFEADVKCITFWTLNKGITINPQDIKTRKIEELASQLHDTITVMKLIDEDVFVTAERIFRLNWVLASSTNHGRLSAIKYGRLKFSQYLLNRPTSHLNETFINHLFSESRSEATVQKIELYKPKQPFSFKAAQVAINEVNTTEDTTKNILGELTENMRMIPPTIPLKLALDNPRDSEVHVIVTAKEELSDEEDDAPWETTESQRFEATLSIKGKSPLQAAQSSEYRITQNSPYEVIYDGLYTSEGQSTVAPPIYIYHHIFDVFRHYLHYPPQPTEDDLKNTLQLMVYLYELPEQNKSSINRDVRPQLEKILNVDVPPLEADRRSSGPNGMAYINVVGDKVPQVILEIKNSVGSGSCDPCIQAAFSFKRSCQGVKNAIRFSCCPTFLIHGAGPWLGISGAVFADKVIVQRLTDMQWFGLSFMDGDIQLWKNTRFLLALRESLKELANFYQNKLDTSKPWIPNNPHPRFFPYPTSCTVEIQNQARELRWEYQRALQDDPQCMTFLAKLTEGDKIVVKFVSSYGDYVHRFLAGREYAPQLLYYGPLSKDTPVLPMSPLHKNALPGLNLQPAMFMVVMEYIDTEPMEKIPTIYRPQIEEILVAMYGEGYVFGDLRNQNILIHFGKVKLMDFNWSGKYDWKKHDRNRLPEKVRNKIVKRTTQSLETEKYAYYPSSLNTSIDWAKGVGRLMPILPEHDWDMVDRLVFE